MAARKPRSEWTPKYRRLVERAERLGYKSYREQRVALSSIGKPNTSRRRALEGFLKSAGKRVNGGVPLQPARDVLARYQAAREKHRLNRRTADGRSIEEVLEDRGIIHFTERSSRGSDGGTDGGDAASFRDQPMLSIEDIYDQEDGWYDYDWEDWWDNYTED